MKSVTRLRASSPISECSESTPLLSNCDSNTKPVHVDAGRHPDHDKAQTSEYILQIEAYKLMHSFAEFFVIRNSCVF